MSKGPWSEEQKQRARDARNKRKVEAVKLEQRTRTPIGAKRNLIGVVTTPRGFKDRVVNDVPGRLKMFQAAGYEFVRAEGEQLGSTHVDGYQVKDGVLCRNVGNGITAYVMRQREDYYRQDQQEKDRLVDETEDGMRKKKLQPHEATDGFYGEVSIG